MNVALSAASDSEKLLDAIYEPELGEIDSAYRGKFYSLIPMTIRLFERQI